MNTSSTAKQLAKCASKANATHPHLASVAHIDSYLYATDSYKLARVTVDEKGQEGETVYYDGKMLAALPRGIPLAQTKKDIDEDYPNVEVVIKQKLDNAKFLGIFQVQYLIDLLNIIKTKSDTLTLSRREGDFEPLMLEAKEVLGVLMPMNPKR